MTHPRNPRAYPNRWLLYTARNILGHAIVYILGCAAGYLIVLILIHGRTTTTNYIGALVLSAALTALTAVLLGERRRAKNPPRVYAAGHLYRVPDKDPAAIKFTPGGTQFGTQLVHAETCTVPGCPFVDPRTAP